MQSAIEIRPEESPASGFHSEVEEMLPDLIPCNIPEGAALHYNGCGGWCPDCFQKEYCETRKELWPDL